MLNTTGEQTPQVSKRRQEKVKRYQVSAEKAIISYDCELDENNMPIEINYDCEFAGESDTKKCFFKFSADEIYRQWTHIFRNNAEERFLWNLSKNGRKSESGRICGKLEDFMTVLKDGETVIAKQDLPIAEYFETANKEDEKQ